MQYEHYLYKGYGCDKDGTLYSTKGKRRTVIHHTGYQVMAVRKDGKTKQYRAHRFIYECVSGKAIPQGMLINHKDGVKSNNHYDNLEIVTPAQNTQHAFATGLMNPMVGEKNGNARINAGTVRTIIRDIIKGVDNDLIAIKFKLDPKHISLIRHKKRWKFIFEEPEFKDYQPSRSTGTGKKQERSTTIENPLLWSE